jgi:hypothetical protein
MATTKRKKATTKRAATKRTAKTKRITKPRRGLASLASVTVNADRITFQLTPEEVQQAKACLAQSGEIRYSFRDIRVTKLPSVLDDGKLID